MLQESVYVKMAIDKQSADSTIKKVKKYVPPEGDIMVLLITEKQFSSMEVVLGESKSDVVDNMDRVLSL